MNNDEMSELIGEFDLIHVNPVIFCGPNTAKKLAASGHFIVYALRLTEQSFRRLWSFCVDNNLYRRYDGNEFRGPDDPCSELETSEFRLIDYQVRMEETRFFVYSRKVLMGNMMFGVDRSFVIRRGEPKRSTPTMEQIYFKLINEEGAIKSMAYNICHERKLKKITEDQVAKWMIKRPV